MNVSNGYKGNQLLKAKGTKINWTPEIIEEYIKCENDPVYFAKKYMKIIHVDKGRIPFDMYDYQKEIVKTAIDNRYVAVVAARQCGKTTVVTAIILHYLIFNSHKTIGILSNKGDSSKEILDRIKFAYESLPRWLQHGVVEWNKNSIELEGERKIVAGTTSSASIRGSSIAFLYLDEVAFIPGYEEFFASVYPTISSGDTTKLLMTSTPNGLNHFYDIVEGARKGTNNYKLIEVPWDRVPGRDEKWKIETLKALNNNVDQFEVEYNIQFIGSSGSLIRTSSLKLLEEKYPIEQNEEQTLKMYEKPNPASTYIMTVDVARGTGNDHSAFSIFDVTSLPYRQVCTFYDKWVTPAEYAQVIYRVGGLFNDAHVLIEINDLGEQVADILFELEYENIIHTEARGRAGARVAIGYNKSVRRGLRTTAPTKMKGCSILKLLIEQRKMELVDKETILELKSFVLTGQTYKAEEGKHDDLCMCLVLFAWLSKDDFFQEMTDIDTLGNLRTKTEKQIEDDLLPFGFHQSEIEREFEDVSDRFGFGF